MTDIAKTGLEVRGQQRKHSGECGPRLADNAGATWTWRTMAHTLGFRCDEVHTSRIWSRWQAVTEEFAQPVTPAMTVAGTCTADQMVPGLGRSSTPLFATPSCYRGHRLLLLWYMRASLRLQQQQPGGAQVGT